MVVEALTSRDVRTTVNYFSRPDRLDQPMNYHAGPDSPDGVPAPAISHDRHSVIVHNARGKEDMFGLDISGFQWVNYPSVEKEFLDKERIKRVYYPEVEELLKKHVVGVERVFVYNHTIRRNQAPQTKDAGLKPHGPAHFVHCDHTFASAEEQVRRRLPDDAERLLKGRYQIINVWRPIISTVSHYPLGVVDFRSINAETDLIPVRLIFSKSEAWSYDVIYNPCHEWYYLSDQTPDEVLLLKHFDSDTSKARLSPHSAFPDMTSPPDAPHRQSIEVSALVFDGE